MLLYYTQIAQSPNISQRKPSLLSKVPPSFMKTVPLDEISTSSATVEMKVVTHDG